MECCSYLGWFKVQLLQMFLGVYRLSWLQLCELVTVKGSGKGQLPMSDM